MKDDDILRIDVDAAQAQRWFGQLLARGSDLTGLMADIGEIFMHNTQQRLDRGVKPDGTPQKPLADGSGRTPLEDTKRMRDDMSPAHGPNWVELRAHAKQAKWQQEGTKPYIIMPKNGKALAFGPPASRLFGKNKGKVGPAYVVKKVHHPGLPARPFIGVGTEDDRDITATAIAWLDLTPSGPTA